jgi:hypothetical protein
MLALWRALSNSWAGPKLFNEKEEHLVHDGDAVVVLAGTYHNVVNTSKTAMLKLYTIYSPPNHPDGTVHKTKAQAELQNWWNTIKAHGRLFKVARAADRTRV